MRGIHVEANLNRPFPALVARGRVARRVALLGRLVEPPPRGEQAAVEEAAAAPVASWFFESLLVEALLVEALLVESLLVVEINFAVEEEPSAGRLRGAKILFLPLHLPHRVSVLPCFVAGVLDGIEEEPSAGHLRGAVAGVLEEEPSAGHRCCRKAVPSAPRTEELWA